MLILLLLLKQQNRIQNYQEQFIQQLKKVRFFVKKYFVYFYHLVEKAGGKCLPCVVDVREEQTVIKAFEEAAKKFGGIDILINNASAISLTDTPSTTMKRYDLMHSINARGSYLWYRIITLENVS